jgi:anti-anti-sigma factor
VVDAVELPVVVVSLEGELDATCDRRVQRQLLDAVALGRGVVIDLSALTFCDSMGLAVFLRAHHAAERAGTALTVRNARENVARLFDLTGIGELLGRAPERLPEAPG